MAFLLVSGALLRRRYSGEGSFEEPGQCSSGPLYETSKRRAFASVVVAGGVTPDCAAAKRDISRQLFFDASMMQSPWCFEKEYASTPPCPLHAPASVEQNFLPAPPPVLP